MAQEEQKSTRRPNFKSISGKGQDLYLESVWVNTITSKDKTGAPKLDAEGNAQTRDIIAATVRKRRDVNPDADYAGAYVSSFKNSKGALSHNQLIQPATLNAILEANGKDALTAEQLHAFAGKDENGKKHPVVSGRDAVAFTGNVFSDKDRKGNHKFNPNPDAITAPSAPFDYDKERELNAKASAASKERKAEKDAKTAADEHAVDDEIPF